MPGGNTPPGQRTRRFGLDAERRLRRREDFERLLREGKRQSFEGYAFYHGVRETGPPRLGMLVTKKHAARATERNHIKRCIREAFRLEQESLGAMDLLVRPPYGARGCAEMVAKLRRFMTKLKT